MQYARPSSDIENPGGWAIEPLWDKIEEEPFDDGDFAHSPKTATGDSFTIGLSAITDPEIHTGHIIRIRAQTGVSGTFKYELMQGAVVIKDSGDVVLTTAFAEYNMTLSEGEAANITDYTVLRVRVTAVITQKNQYQDVSWIRVDVPDLAGEEHSGSGSISGNGSSIGTIKKGGIGSALKSAGGVLLAIGLAGMLAIASIAGGGSQIAVAKKAVSGIVSVSGGGSIVVTGTKSEGEEHSGTASISGNGLLVSEGIRSSASPVAISANGSLLTSGKKLGLSSISISTGGVVSSEGEKTISIAISISDKGSLVSLGLKTVEGIVGISQDSILEALGKKETSDTIILSGNGSLTASGTAEEGEAHNGIASISDNGSFASTGKKEAFTPAIITKQGELLGTGIKETSGLGLISGTGILKVIGQNTSLPADLFPVLFNVSPRKRRFETGGRKRIFKVVPREKEFEEDRRK